MAKLVEIARARDTPAHLFIDVGDVLAVKAVGAIVRHGEDVLELLGPLRPAVVAPGGNLIAPEGPPNTVMLVARHAGSATLEVISGDPWGKRERVVLEITVVGR